MRIRISETNRRMSKQCFDLDGIISMLHSPSCLLICIDGRYQKSRCYNATQFDLLECIVEAKILEQRMLDNFLFRYICFGYEPPIS